MKILEETFYYSADEKLGKFGYGEWVEEPDLIEYEYKNYEGDINRNRVGALCGYVHLPTNHPWNGVGYYDINAKVHGNLTFAEYIIKNKKNIYTIGFDCAHFEDIVPLRVKLNGSIEKILQDKKYISSRLKFKVTLNPTYKNIEYVLKECQNLIDQAIEAENEKLS